MPVPTLLDSVSGASDREPFSFSGNTLGLLWKDEEINPETNPNIIRKIAAPTILVFDKLFSLWISIISKIFTS